MIHESESTPFAISINSWERHTLPMYAKKETEFKDYKVSLKFQLKDIISRLPLFPKTLSNSKTTHVVFSLLLLDSPGSEKSSDTIKNFSIKSSVSSITRN